MRRHALPKRLAATVSAHVLYVAFFPLVFPWLGYLASAATCIPVVIAAYLFGAPYAFLSAAMLVILNDFYFQWAGAPPPQVTLQNGLGAVEDTSIGIAPESLAALFKPFSRVGDRRRHHYEGAGPGLALSMQCCMLMQGSIEVESTLAVGSRFLVRVPAHLPPGGPVPAENGP
jgi:hypothetical protein